MYRSREPLKLRRRIEALAASRCMSSSSKTKVSNSRTTFTGCTLAPLCMNFSASVASDSNRSISLRSCLPMPGRTTLTTASRPSCSVAGWTCAIEAEASGLVSKEANTSLTGSPSAFSMMARASSPGNGGTWSCSKASSSAISGGSRSRRVDRICPNLTYTGPRSCSARRRRSPRGSPDTSLPPGMNTRSQRTVPGKRAPSNNSSSR
jgi:hypothetical protein